MPDRKARIDVYWTVTGKLKMEIQLQWRGFMTKGELVAPANLGDAVGAIQAFASIPLRASRGESRRRIVVSRCTVARQ
jgi:hypothetical protein